MSEKRLDSYTNDLCTSVNARLKAFDLSVQLSESGKCDVKVQGSGASRIKVAFENGLLRISESDFISADSGMSLLARIKALFTRAGEGAGKVYVYLPASEPDALDLSSQSGDIEINGVNAGEVNLSTASGDISAHMIKSARGFGAKSESGDFSGREISAAGARLRVRSGDIKLEHAVLNAALEIDSGSGDVELSKCEGTQLKLESASGDVLATGRFAESFFVRTHSGDAEIKLDSASGFVKSTSGDIRYDGDCGELMFESTSGDIRAMGQFDGIRVSSVSGDLGITARKPTVDHIDARSVSGDIDIWSSEQAAHRIRAHSTSGDVRKH